MDPISVYTSFKKTWDLLAPYLKRADSYLILVSVCLAYVVALFHSRYEYWPVVIVVLTVFSLLFVVVAAVCSWLSPFSGAWKAYGIGLVVSLALLIWLGSRALFYLHPILLLLGLLAAVWKGGSNVASK